MSLVIKICRPALLGLILVSSFPSPGAESEGAGAEAAPGWRIQAGQAELQTAGQPLVTGVFIVSAPPGEIDPLAAPMQGGACLLADLTPFGIGRASCVTSTDCNAADSIDRQHDPRLAEYVGYCAARDGSDEAPRCWTRPGPASTHCRRTVDSLRLTAGEHSLGPVIADPLGNGEPLPEWAVYACMAQTGHDRACGEAVSPHRQVSVTPPPRQRD